MRKGLLILQIAILLSVGFLQYQVVQLKRSETLGATIPTVVALFETSLASKITSSATSMTLVSGTDKAGTALSGTYGFIIDEGSSNEEFVVCTAASTALTSCLRGVSVTDGDTEVTALKKEHRRGATIKITNYPQLAILSRILNGQETIPNRIAYQTHPSFVGTGASTSLASVKYVDDTNNTGAANATTTVQGLVEQATVTETNNGTGTGGTGARLFVGPSEIASSSWYANIPSTGQKAALAGSLGTPSATNLYVTLQDVASASFATTASRSDWIIRSDGDSVPSSLWIDITKLNITASASGDMIVRNSTNYGRLAYPTITNGSTFELMASASAGTPAWNDSKNDFAYGQGTVVDTNATLVAASVSFTPNWIQLHYSCDGANASPSGSAVYLRKTGADNGLGVTGEGADGNGAYCFISSGNGISFSMSLSTDGDSIYISASESGTAQTTAYYWFAGR